MAYKRHDWKKKDAISAARLNNIEDGIEEALKAVKEPGPQGEPGIGLFGEAQVVEHLSSDADTAALVGKVNELIDVLKNRGILA